MTNKANEPAFPLPLSHPTAPCTGLTKREYFAAMAMQGFVAHGIKAPNEESIPELLKTTAQYSLRLADALCAELEKGRK